MPLRLPSGDGSRELHMYNWGYRCAFGSCRKGAHGCILVYTDTSARAFATVKIPEASLTCDVGMERKIEALDFVDEQRDVELLGTADCWKRSTKVWVPCWETW